jgi:hypothetical protein
VKYRLLRLYGADGEGDEGNDDEGAPSPDGDEGKPETRILTSEELEKLSARVADRSSRKARKELAERLGFKSVNELEEWTKTNREAEQAKKTEDEKARDELAKEKAAAEADRKTTRTQRLELQIEKAIVRSGVVDDKKLDRLLTLVYAEIEEGSEENDWGEQITAALEDVKGDVPELFAGAKKSHGSGDGGASGGTDTDEPEESEQDKELAKEYAGGPQADWSDF